MNALKEYDAAYMRFVCWRGPVVANVRYIAVYGFWQAEELAELVEGPQDVVKWRGVGVDLLGT